MLLNNLKRDMQGAMKEEGVTQKEMAERLGTSESRISQLLKVNPLNKSYIEFYDKLGYDIVIETVRKQTHPDACYGLLRYVNQLILIKWGESGYTPQPNPVGDGALTQDFVDKLNVRDFGVEHDEAEAMQTCCLIESLKSEADWQRHYASVLRIINEARKETL